MPNYVISDLHGQMALYHSILRKIKFSAADHLYILGDAIDRGADGIAILQDIMQRKNVTFLLGNHEDIMLRVIKSIRENNVDRSAVCTAWWQNGGEATANHLFKLEKEKQDEIEKFLLNCPLSLTVNVGKRTFLMAHACPLNMTEAEYAQNCSQFLMETSDIDAKMFTYREWLLWQRVEKDDEFPEDVLAVFGHTPTAYYQNDKPYKIWKYENKIGLDCGLASLGRKNENCRLGCLCLDDLTEIYVTSSKVKNIFS